MKRSQRGYKEWDRGKQSRKREKLAVEKKHDALMRDLFWKGMVGLALVGLFLAFLIQS